MGEHHHACGELFRRECGCCQTVYSDDTIAHAGDDKADTGVVVIGVDVADIGSGQNIGRGFIDNRSKVPGQHRRIIDRGSIRLLTSLRFDEAAIIENIRAGI